MPTRRQLIQKITLNSNASSVTFSNIPQNYTDLRIVCSARTDRPTEVVDVLNIGFNGSTSNFSNRWLDGTGSVARSGSNIGTSGRGFWYTPCAGATSNTFSNNELYIPNYSGSNNKSYQAKSIQETNGSTAYMISVAGLWSSTTNISSIEISILYGTNFLANSTFYLYGITHVPIIRGGGVSIAGGYKIHTFRSTASLQVIEGGDIEYLIIAGGGGGGMGGGGGAGGMLTGRTRLAAQNHTITVGAGGNGETTGNGVGSNGSTSSAFSISTTGGGGGGSRDVSGNAGGSGGGAGIGGGSRTGGAGTSGQGNNGGNNFSSPNYGAGGGGGKSAAGANGTSSTGGNGGAGLASSISGSTITYAGGGGGGIAYQTTGVGAGGAGGGGTGGGADNPGTNGLQGLGGGGGGGGLSTEPGADGGNGGSGIVIIRYPYDGN